MKRTSVAIAPLGLIGAVGVLGLVCAGIHHRSISAGIQARAASTLGSVRGLEGVRVEVARGRDVVLRGEVMSSGLSAKAATVAGTVHGVRRVVNGLDVVSPTPAGIAPAPGPQASLDRLLEFSRVEFEAASPELTPEGRAILNDVAAILRSWPDLRAEISGHTDGTGSEKGNFDLSLRRAEAVHEYLGGTIDASRFSVVGYASERPIADDSTEEGRRRNRRIEFRVIQGEGR